MNASHPFYTYRSCSILVSLLSLLLVADTAASATSAVVDWMQIEYLRELAEGREWIQYEAEQNDRRQKMISIAELVLFGVEAFLFLMWIYRASQNAWALGGPGMKFKPAWCVGWFFVPLMSHFPRFLMAISVGHNS